MTGKLGGHRVNDAQPIHCSVDEASRRRPEIFQTALAAAVFLLLERRSRAKRFFLGRALKISKVMGQLRLTRTTGGMVSTNL